MTRGKQIRALILDALRDDYEDFDSVAERALESAIAGDLVTLPDMVELSEVLADAVADGYARAARDEADGWQAVQGDIRMEPLDDLWFQVTVEGERLRSLKKVPAKTTG